MSALVRKIFGLALFSTTPGNLLPKHSFHLSSKRLPPSNAPPYPELDALELLLSRPCMRKWERLLPPLPRGQERTRLAVRELPAQSGVRIHIWRRAAKHAGERSANVQRKA